MQIAPWHSVGGGVYHTETECQFGRQVKEGNQRQGSGGKFHCEHCKKRERRRTILLERARRRASATTLK